MPPGVTGFPFASLIADVIMIAMAETSKKYTYNS